MLLLGADCVICSWKFACLHLKLDAVEEDEEDVHVSIDFHDTGFPLKLLSNCHGDIQEHLCSTYPSYSGNIYEDINNYFNHLNIPNLLNKFQDLHELNGDARRAALEADVQSRAKDVEDSPAPLGRVNKRNHSEAYDEHEEEVLSPGGTKTKKVVRTEVDTPTFKERLAENARRGVKSRVDLSLHMYDQLLDNVDKEGFICFETRQGILINI